MTNDLNHNKLNRLIALLTIEAELRAEDRARVRQLMEQSPVITPAALSIKDDWASSERYDEAREAERFSPRSAEPMAGTDISREEFRGAFREFLNIAQGLPSAEEVTSVGKPNLFIDEPPCTAGNFSLWRCDDGTFDIINEDGETVRTNIPNDELASVYMANLTVPTKDAQPDWYEEFLGFKVSTRDDLSDLTARIVDLEAESKRSEEWIDRADVRSRVHAEEANAVNVRLEKFRQQIGKLEQQMALATAALEKLALRFDTHNVESHNKQ